MTSSPITLDGRGSRIEQLEYEALLAEVTRWVQGPGEQWAELIEQTDAVRQSGGAGKCEAYGFRHDALRCS